MLLRAVFGGIVKSLQTLLFVTFLTVICSGCSSSTHLLLEPQIAPTQQAGMNKEQFIVVSQQFNSVTLSPHTLGTEPGSALRFYLEIKNGSALDVPFRAQDVAVFLNGNRVALLSTEAVRARILQARDEAVQRARKQQKRVVYGDIAPVEDLDDLDTDWSPGTSLSDLQKLQRSSEDHIRTIEDRTRAQLTKITQHSLTDRTLLPGQTYDTFIEFIPPSTLQAGDILSVKVGVEPDVHEFRFVTANS